MNILCTTMISAAAVRWSRPRRVVSIGGGFSQLVRAVRVHAALLATVVIVSTSCSGPGSPDPLEPTAVSGGQRETIPPRDGVQRGPSTTATDALRARLYRPGDCVIYEPDNSPGNNVVVGINDLTVTRVVPCDQPHFYEITGIYQVPERSQYPTDQEWADVFRRDGDGCKPLAASYLNGPLDPYGKFRVSGIKPTR